MSAAAEVGAAEALLQLFNVAAVPTHAPAPAPAPARAPVVTRHHYERNKRFDRLFEASTELSCRSDPPEERVRKRLEFWESTAARASHKAGYTLKTILTDVKAHKGLMDSTLRFSEPVGSTEPTGKPRSLLLRSCEFSDLIAEEVFAAFHFIRTWVEWRGYILDEATRLAEWEEMFGDYLYIAKAWIPAGLPGAARAPATLPPYPSNTKVNAMYHQLLRTAARSAPEEELEAAKLAVKEATEEHIIAAMQYACRWVEQAWPRFRRTDPKDGTVIAITMRENRLQYILENLGEFGYLAMALMASSFP